MNFIKKPVFVPTQEPAQEPMDFGDEEEEFWNPPIDTQYPYGGKRAVPVILENGRVTTFFYGPEDDEPDYIDYGSESSDWEEESDRGDW